MNYIPQVAEMLGVNLEEEFTINTYDVMRFRFSQENGLESWQSRYGWTPEPNLLVSLLLKRNYIIKRPTQLE